MPKTVVIDLQADLGDVKKQLDAMNKQLEEVKNNGKDVKDGMNKVPGALKKVAGGFKGIGLAMKAMGIGLILEAFAILREVLGENQVVMDFFNIAMETTKILFREVLDFVLKLKDPLANLFKDPKQALIDFGNAIKDNLMNRLEGMLLLIPRLGEAIGKLFSGDFAEAGQIALDAVAQVGLGIEDFTEKAIEFGETAIEVIGDLVDTVTKEVKSATAIAKTLVQLRKELILDEAELEAITLRNLKIQEELRQIRDDEAKSIEERAAANILLGEQLQKQAEEEEELIRKKIRLRQIESDLDPNNVEKQAELIRAKTELLELEERITGFKSEQLVNEVALNKEIAERNKLIADRANIGETDALKQIEREQKQLDDYILTLTKGTIAYEQALNDRKQLDVDANTEEERRAKQLADAKTALIGGVFGFASALAKDNEALSKGIAAAQTIWSTAQAIMTALSDPTLIGGTRYIAAATAAVTGATQLATILSTSSDNANTSPTAPQAPAGGAPTIAVGGGGNPNSQLIAALERQTETPQRAFVVTKDVSSGQELDRNLILNASL